MSRDTIRSTNEKCQKIIDDLEVADFVQTLKSGFDKLYLQDREQRDSQEDMRKFLAQIHCSLHEQHMEALDAITVINNPATDQPSARTSAEASPQREVPTLLSQNLQISARQGDTLDAIHAQLRTQQASLDNLHEALQCLVDESAKPASADTSQASSAARSLQVSDAVSIVKIAAASASMFLLGYTTGSRATNVPQNAFLDQRESSSGPTNIWQRILDRRESSSGPTNIWKRPGSEVFSLRPRSGAENSWASEFDGGANPPQEQSSKSTYKQPIDDEPELRVDKKGYSVRVWFCCSCGDGPHANWQKLCVSCEHSKCSGCSYETDDTMSPNKQDDHAPTSYTTQTSSKSPISTDRKAHDLTFRIKSETWTCNECGAVNSDWRDTCPECGSSRL